MSTNRLILCAYILPLVAAGCQLEATDNDVSRFREPLPETSRITVLGPEDSVAAGSKASASVMANGAATGEGNWAKYYAFTRQVRGGMNHATGDILGLVWLLANMEPTDVSDRQATWGPFTEDLSPVSYRFIVREDPKEKGGYAYLLEGRPKASKSDSEWVTVLEGQGYGALNDKHGQGKFSLDMDAAHKLDPIGSPDEGVLNITHELPRQRDLKSLLEPRYIKAEMVKGAENWTAISRRQELGTGSLLVTAHADVDDAKNTKLEDVSIASQWKRGGAGRADVTMSGGDLPATVKVVSVTECWGEDFARAYYKDSVDFEPPVGDVSACVYANAYVEPATP